MEKRLTRVEEGKMLCGVCAGIGKYFNIDPTLVRLGFVILSCFGGSGMLLRKFCSKLGTCRVYQSARYCGR